MKVNASKVDYCDGTVHDKGVHISEQATQPTQQEHATVKPHADDTLRETKKDKKKSKTKVPVVEDIHEKSSTVRDKLTLPKKSRAGKVIDQLTPRDEKERGDEAEVQSEVIGVDNAIIGKKRGNSLELLQQILGADESSDDEGNN